MNPLFSTASLRPKPSSLSQSTSTPTALLLTRPPRRHATLLRRPKRPYTFSQLVALSDGSTYLHRTTSPQPVYRSTKDTRNAPLWNPSSQKLLNVEADEAGRLRAFRERFGRGFDVRAATADQGGEASGEAESEVGKELVVEKEEVVETREEDENLMDLISGFGQAQDQRAKKGAGDTENEKKAGGSERTK